MEQFINFLRRVWLMIKGLIKRNTTIPSINQAKSPIVPINISYPNMPKAQPCPRGHGWKKRTRKTLGGADYLCNKCGAFFVSA